MQISFVFHFFRNRSFSSTFLFLFFFLSISHLIFWQKKRRERESVRTKAKTLSCLRKLQTGWIHPPYVQKKSISLHLLTIHAFSLSLSHTHTFLLFLSLVLTLYLSHSFTFSLSHTFTFLSALKHVFCCHLTFFSMPSKEHCVWAASVKKSRGKNCKKTFIKMGEWFSLTVYVAFCVSTLWKRTHTHSLYYTHTHTHIQTHAHTHTQNVVQ